MTVIDMHQLELFDTLYVSERTVFPYCDFTEDLPNLEVASVPNQVFEEGDLFGLQGSTISETAL
jgi:hypothetical protein